MQPRRVTCLAHGEIAHSEQIPRRHKHGRIGKGACLAGVSAYSVGVDIVAATQWHSKESKRWVLK